MKDRPTPTVFPSHKDFVSVPAVPDRQLWAIGMIVAQWSMTEWYIDMNTRQLIGDDQAVLDEYKKIRGFQQNLAFWKTQHEMKTKEPLRSRFLGLVPRIQNLSTQRDEVVHRLWGGGMEGSSWNAGGLASADAGLMPNPGEKVETKVQEGLIPFTWNATFSRLKRMGTEIAILNRDLFETGLTAGPPHGYVDTGGHVGP